MWVLRKLALLLVLAASALLGRGVLATEPWRCPAAEHLPQLTIDTVHDPALPVVDDWQVFFGATPLSDYQLAMLAGNDVLIDRTRAELEARGSHVYAGTLMAAAGMIAASFGWVLFGQDKLAPGKTLPLAIGGVGLAALGLYTITASLETPLEPLLAPTPRHRLTREEVRRLVTAVNHQLYRDICKASAASQAAPVP